MSTATPTPPLVTTITLNIETFNDIGTGNFCTLSGITVAPAAGEAVSANPLPPFTVRVTNPASATPPPPGLQLIFQATGPQPPTTDPAPTPLPSAVYNVEAVYFSGSGQGSVFGGPQQIIPAPNPQTNPPLGTSVLLTDIPTPTRPTGRWNFAVIVKRIVTDSSGTTWVSVGIIDPPIDNEPGNFV